MVRAPTDVLTFSEVLVSVKTLEIKSIGSYTLQGGTLKSPVRNLPKEIIIRRVRPISSSVCYEDIRIVRYGTIRCHADN